ncbi:acyltransferase [Putridiphycobacter roseus]|uniref:Acyltransferase n=2 Tax=Putridiphycobacter roseus TaxID=2219161 RepID=A0A2W1N1F9_9FLAO|nr:acyltransferase [Putridiphycobacter roseus]
MIKAMGWDIHPELPPEINKCVLVMAPHTSNWDFFIGHMAFWGIFKVDVKFLIKKELYIPPFSWFLNWMGGIPVDRKQKTNLTEKLKTQFDNSKQLTLVVSPEGTRSYSKKWKKGFYYIAQAANVPIVLGFIDYATKTGGIIQVFKPTNNIEADIATIKEIYKNYSGKYPENGIK